MTHEEQIIKLRNHAANLAEALADMTGYMRAMRTDRKIERDGETYALQTLDYAEGAAEYCDKADAILTAHDELGEVCPECDGSGGVDSGGVTPWGEGITLPCRACNSETV